MKDLTEWANADGSISPEIEELFRAAQPTREMTEAERLRSTASVRAIAATPAPTWPAIIAKNVLAVVLGMFTAGALFGGGSSFDSKILEEKRPTANDEPPLIALAPEDEAPAPVVIAEDKQISRNEPKMSPKLAEQTAIVPINRRATQKVATQKPLARAPSPGADAAVVNDPPPPDEDTLARELMFLEKARAAVASKPADTLDLLDAYAREFPAGRHVLAREVLAIDALLKLRRKAEARARAEALLPRASGTPFEARVQKQLDEAK